MKVELCQQIGGMMKRGLLALDMIGLLNYGLIGMNFKVSKYKNTNIGMNFSVGKNKKIRPKI